MTLFLGYALAIAIGISLGLLGGGGSVLALPVLVYVVGVEPKPAIAMTLIIVGTVSVIGLISHVRRGNVAWKQGLVFGSATTVGAYAGARIATLPMVTSTLQMMVFAIAMLTAAGLMIYRSSKPQSAPVVDIADGIYVKPVCRYCWVWLLTEGLGVGLLTGLVGVGGGFAIVPALVLLGNVPMRQAIGTSLLIIAFNSVAGLLGYIGHVSIDWHLTLTFTFLAGIGTVIGSYLAQYISAKHLQKSFGYFLLAVAMFVLFQNRQSFGFSQTPDRPARQHSPERSQPPASLMNR